MLTFVAIGCAAALASTPAQLLEQGMAAQRAGKTETAIIRYTECLRQDPGFAACHWELGWSYWKENNWEKVVDHWRKVKTLDPDHPELPKHLPTAEAHLATKNAVQTAVSPQAAPATVRPALPSGKTIRIRAVGDLMIGTDFPEPMFPANDAVNIFDGVVDWLKDADVTFGNLEGPLCDGGTTTKCKPEQNCYAFRSPTKFAKIYQEAGFDLMSTANNHAEDFGVACRTQTEDALKAVGIGYSGRPGTLASIERNGVKIGMIGFHTNQNSHYVNDHPAAIALVKQLKATHDLVIVSFHGGAEGSKAQHVPNEMEVFYSEKRGHLREFARAVIGAGADVVLGHGPHVLRGMEVVDGHLVAYSLGNFATYGRFNLAGPLGLTSVVEIVVDDKGKLVSGKILAGKQEGEGIPVKDPTGEAINVIRSLSEEDFGPTAPIIAQDGTFAPRR